MDKFNPAKKVLTRVRAYPSYTNSLSVRSDVDQTYAAALTILKFEEIDRKGFPRPTPGWYKFIYNSGGSIQGFYVYFHLLLKYTS